MPTTIDQWLLDNGFSDYVSVFVSQQIDHEVLVELTDADLKELGVPLGPRKKLLKAIAALDGTDTSLATHPAPFSASRGDAERRHLTVMFCDLVGSTALSSRFDPEDLSAIVRDFQDACAGVVSRFDGYVARFMGDGLLVYFGYPRAHEDDAERALHAGLEIIRRVGELQPRADLQLHTRVGVASGQVVVGETLGDDAAREQVVMGETPNLAARLQGIAASDQLVVADGTRQLCGQVFEFADLGKQPLKGFERPVPAFAVLGEASPESRFDAHQGQGFASLVGRDQELGLLLQRWQSAGAGEGQMVLLSGEAGIGKSRIARAIIDAVATDPHVRISFQCSPYHGDSALHPAIQQLHRAAGFTAGDDIDAKLTKLDALLTQTGCSSDDKALIAALLELGAGQAFAELDLTPPQQRVRTLDALVNLVVGTARLNPVLFVVEDAHWIDATTLELIELCLEQATRSRVLIVITARPGFEHNLGGHPVVTSLALNRLGREQISAIISQTAGGKSLPAELLDEIVAKTDGVPLFVEELTKTVLESGALEETDDAWVLERPLSELAIPASLHDSLMARLDRLKPIKEVAQTAACIGREFDYSLLAAVSPLSDQALQLALEQLVGAQLVYRRGAAPTATYTFKHALVRDAAHESLLKTIRQQMHGRLLAALRGLDSPPELLAYHAETAGEAGQAIDWWQKAGEIAYARPAYEESIGHLGSAIRLVREMGDDQLWAERELTLQVQLSQALLAKRGYGARPTAEAFERALTLTDRLPGTALRFPVLYGAWVGHYLRGEHVQALQRSLQVLELAESQNDAAPRLVAERIAASSHLALGNLGEARRYLELAQPRYDPQEHADLANRFGQEPGAAVHCYQAFVLWLMGYPDQAASHAATAVAIADRLGHVNTDCYVGLHNAVYSLCRGDVEGAEYHMDTATRHAREHGMTLWLDYSNCLQPLIAATRGDAAGLDRHEQGIAAYTESGARLWAPFLKLQYAELLLGFDRPDDAQAAIDTAAHIIARINERWAEAEVHRLQGDIHRAANNHSAALASYEQAIEIAQLQGAVSWRLRATTSLARLLGEQSERQRARDRLQAVYDEFDEGLDSRDLTTARELLGELS